jgi:hypothetical protein
MGEWLSIYGYTERVPPRVSLTITLGDLPEGWIALVLNAVPITRLAWRRHAGWSGHRRALRRPPCRRLVRLLEGSFLRLLTPASAYEIFISG